MSNHNWREIKIGDLAIVKAGGTPRTNIKEYWGGDIRWMSSGELNLKQVYDVEGRITDLGLKKSSAQLLPINSVLIGLAGQGKTRGTVAMNKVPLTTNQSVAAILPCDDIDSYFLYQNLDNRYEEIRRMSTGDGGRGGLNLSIIKSIKVLLPPFPEQKKIAKILSTWDEAIEQNQKLIEQLKLRKKGLMQQLLTGKKRLAGFDGEWKEVSLSDITLRVTKKNSELNDNVVTISAQRGFVKQEDYFNKRVASSTLSGYFLIEKGEFAYNKSYSKGYPMGAFKRLDEFDYAVVTTLYICFKTKNNVNSDFLLEFFEGGMLVKGLMRIAQEGGRAHGLLNISLGDFFGLKLTIPSLEEQVAISKVLNSANQEIQLQEQKLEFLQQQKKGLMQKLLTGQIRVSTND
ncbi:MAG: restriction endonuclease subunit S [Cytophagales bacterium]|nr:restriction endonuclease subunit S [Cytophagales bacterium]